MASDGSSSTWPPAAMLRPKTIAEGFLQAIPADEYPYLREMVVDYAMVAGYDDSADFEFGLDLILGGLQRLLEKECL